MLLGRMLVLLSVLALAATVGTAQPATDDAPACKVPDSETLPDLEKRRQALEQEIARKTAPQSAKADSQAALRKSQGDLLEVLFQIDCLNNWTKREQEPTTRGVFARKPSGAIEVTAYYATSRKQKPGSAPAQLYSAEIAPGLEYGRAVVSIPTTRTAGSLPLPSLWKFERSPDAARHFVLKSVMPLSVDAGRREMAEQLREMKARSLLIFVHGFRTGFQEAALLTAQLAHDLNFPGIAFFYSWPSANQIRSYWQDEEVARLSEGAFGQVLDDLWKLPFTEIYVVAHSMGNRIVGHALQARVDQKKDTKNLREILLAAPDISADIFRAVIAPRLVSIGDARTTIYASSSDIALRASKVVHRFKRLGETTGGVTVLPGMETIDASSASAAYRGFGHLYLVDSPSVIRDVRAIIDGKRAAKLRGLSELGSAPNIYWRLP
jgi:esterase/lipase superfamily enzyme